MRKRFLASLGCGILLLLACCLALRGAGPKHRINRESFDRISAGMTRREVEDILGVPPGDYGSESTREKLHQRSLKQLHLLPPGQEWIWWRGDGLGGCHQVGIVVDEGGKVIDKEYEKLTYGPAESVFVAARRWLGL